MGWFDSQIRERRRFDEELMASAAAGLSEALTGAGGHAARGRASADAVEDILAYLGANSPHISIGNDDVLEILDAQVRSLGIMYREVRLAPGWSREAVGPMLGVRADGTPVALLPKGARGYAYRDHARGCMVALGQDDMSDMKERAYLFYRPLPARALSHQDIYRFLATSVPRRDWVLVIALALFVSALGLAVPAATSYLFSHVVPLGADGLGALAPLLALLLSLSLGQVVFSAMRTTIMGGVVQTASVSLVAALMMRILQLPAAFFRRWSSGDLASRLLSAQSMVALLGESALSVGLSALFSAVFLIQIAVVWPRLLPASLAASVASLLSCLFVAHRKAGVLSDRLVWRARRGGQEVSVVGGIHKIRLAGAQTRVFARWADIYKNEVASTYGNYLDSVALSSVALLGAFGVYAVAASSGIDTASFMGFSMAFGMVCANLEQLAHSAVVGMSPRPFLDLIEPVLEAVPETRRRGQIVERLVGGIELDHVTFSYPGANAPVLDDLSLKIRPGQYVAIVGKTGCGKSTLMRLLLGFDEPQSGAIYYDGRDLASLDLHSLRRKMGVVLQGGRLFAGDLYSNIAVSAPGLTLDGAWRAAELAGIADDIRAMPMGMSTIVSEGGGGISGGQRQRIMIARAIAASPRILLFDEATSALDNLVQDHVAESLASLRCTRITIAHRLSTVRHCDRILVLDQGHIVEDGAYEELIEQNGIFAELVRRQQA